MSGREKPAWKFWSILGESSFPWLRPVAIPRASKGERLTKCSNGKVTAVVRSSRVPVGVFQFAFIQPNGLGQLSSTRVRSVLYDHVLDESQRRLLKEARRVAESSSLDLEIVDLGKLGLFRRAIFRLLHGQGTLTGQGIRLDLQSLSAIEAAFNSSIS